MYAPQGVLAEITAIDVGTSSVIWDAKTSRLYAAVGGAAKVWPYSVLVINPESASPETVIPIGDEPGELAVSNDGQFLYVGINSAGIIRRYRLADGSPDLEIPLRQSSTDRWIARGIVPLPGTDDSLLVWRG